MFRSLLEQGFSEADAFVASVLPPALSNALFFTNEGGNRFNRWVWGGSSTGRLAPPCTWAFTWLYLGMRLLSQLAGYSLAVRRRGYLPGAVKPSVPGSRCAFLCWVANTAPLYAFWISVFCVKIGFDTYILCNSFRLPPVLCGPF